MATRRRKSSRLNVWPPASIGATARAIVAERERAAAEAGAPWFTLALPKPPSVNTAFRNRTARDGKGRGRIPTKAYKDWKREALPAIIAARGPRISGAYELHIWLGRRKGSDLDNYVKCLSDTLKLAGVIADDHLCEDLRVRWSDDLTSKQCRFSIRPFAREASLVR